MLKNQAASCLADRNEASWAFPSNKKPPPWSNLKHSLQLSMRGKGQVYGEQIISSSICESCFFFSVVLFSLEGRWLLGMAQRFRPARVTDTILGWRMWSSVACGLLPVAMAIESLPSWGWERSIAMSSLGNGYSSGGISSCWGTELPLSISVMIEMYWPYPMQLWITGWGCLFSDWKGIMAYWNTSLLSCGKPDMSGVLCSFCLAGMLFSHLLPHKSTSTTTGFLS